MISLPTVRKGMKPKAFKKIWKQLYSGEAETGRPCPGCKKPLSVVEADGEGSELMIDLCRSCQILWFDDKEFSGLPEPEEVPKIEPEKRLEKQTSHAGRTGICCVSSGAV